MADSLPTALVTGAARRIGRAIAEDLAAHGWAVAIHYHRSENAARDVAAAIAKFGGKAAVVSGDLADTAALGGIVSEAARQLGPLTLLVNNASMFEKDGVGAFDLARWQRQLNVNLAAPVFLAEAFAAQLPPKAEGNIVNLLDERIWRPTPNFFSYQLSKSGLHVATDMLAQALAPRVRVNAIAPGPALPSAHSPDEMAFGRLVGDLPLKRAPELADFGRTVRYFVETRAVTGQVIALDGGEHLMRRKESRA